MEQRQIILDQLAARVAALFSLEKDAVTEDLSLEHDLGAKSVHYSQITTYLEDALDIEIPYMAFKRQATIGEAADYLLSLLEA